MLLILFFLALVWEQVGGAVSMCRLHTLLLTRVLLVFYSCITLVYIILDYCLVDPVYDFALDGPALWLSG